MFAAVYPSLNRLNVMQLHSPRVGDPRRIIFNALIIVALIPSRCAAYGTARAAPVPCCARNLLVYGLGGVVAPFVGIKIIDLLVSIIPGM